MLSPLSLVASSHILGQNERLTVLLHTGARLIPFELLAYMTSKGSSLKLAGMGFVEHSSLKQHRLQSAVHACAIRWTVGLAPAGANSNLYPCVHCHLQVWVPASTGDPCMTAATFDSFCMTELSVIFAVVSVARLGTCVIRDLCWPFPNTSSAGGRGTLRRTDKDTRSAETGLSFSIPTKMVASAKWILLHLRT